MCNKWQLSLNRIWREKLAFTVKNRMCLYYGWRVLSLYQPGGYKAHDDV